MLHDLYAHLLSIPLFESTRTCVFNLDKLANLDLFISDFVVEDAYYLGSVLVSILDCLVVLGTLLEVLLQLKYLHFETDDIVILVSEYLFNCGHIDIWFFGETAGLALVEVPGVDLSFHFSILLFDVPDARLEGAILLLDIVDDALVVIVLVPDEVLGGHIAVKVDAGLEDVVVGVDLLAQLLLVLDAAVQQALLGLELFVVVAQDEQGRVIKIFHTEKNIIIPCTITLPNTLKPCFPTSFGVCK